MVLEFHQSREFGHCGHKLNPNKNETCSKEGSTSGADKEKKKFWYSVQGLGLMARTPQAGTGDSVI